MLAEEEDEDDGGGASLQPGRSSSSGRLGADDYGTLSRPSVDDDRESIPPGEAEFNTEAAHSYWTWDPQRQNWYHIDEATSNIIWAALSFS
jgi:hypothetical protein